MGIVERALDVVGLSDWITEWSPEWTEGTDQSRKAPHQSEETQ